MSNPNQISRLGVMERMRNLGDSMLAKVAIAGVGVFGTASAVAEYALIHPDSAAADDISTQTDTTSQECTDTILARPAIVHPLHMNQAGIRPFTGPRHSQAVSGSLGYPDASCTDDIRVASGRIQDFRNGRWSPIWGQSVGSLIGNDEGVSRIIVDPGHADPGYRYLFNDCMPGKGFHPVRIVLSLMLKDRETKAIDDEEQYILHVPVRGNCDAARHSRQVAEKQMEENYGI